MAMGPWLALAVSIACLQAASGQMDEPPRIPPEVKTVASPDGEPLSDAPCPPPPPEAKASEEPREEKPPSIFDRPPYEDRHQLSLLMSTGAGRFNIIDWEARPTWDRLWWLRNWPSEDQTVLHASVGFNIHWWAGPTERNGQPGPDLPAQVYDLYLEGVWSQQWTDTLTSEVNVRPGMYTDFRTTPPQAARIPGRGVFLLELNDDSSLVGGVDYLQRNQLKTLPVAGVQWQPTPRTEFRLLFPEPKIAVQLSSSKQLWGYVAGEYGGGRWAYKNARGEASRVEYSDLRILWGLEWREGKKGKIPFLSESASFVEVGYVFDRRIRIVDPNQEFAPREGWVMRLGYIW